MKKVKSVNTKGQKDFQREIRDIMETYHLSEEAIADRLGIRAITVYRWEKGSSRPRSRIVLQTLEEFKKELHQKSLKTKEDQ